MPIVTINGTFSYASANNIVDLIVSDYNGPAPAPPAPPPTHTPGYPTHQPSYTEDFTEIHNDVISGQMYNVSINGYTPGDFNLQIIGDIVQPIAISNPYSGAFSDVSIFFVVK